MLSKNRIAAKTILLLLFYTSFLSAQQQIDTIDLVTTFIPLKSSEAGRNISVISHEDIENSCFTSLDDLLQNFPGIEMQTRNRFGAQADITMRGSTFPQARLFTGQKLLVVLLI